MQSGKVTTLNLTQQANMTVIFQQNTHIAGRVAVMTHLLGGLWVESFWRNVSSSKLGQVHDELFRSNYDVC